MEENREGEGLKLASQFDNPVNDARIMALADLMKALGIVRITYDWSIKRNPHRESDVEAWFANDAGDRVQITYDKETGTGIHHRSEYPEGIGCPPGCTSPICSCPGNEV